MKYSEETNSQDINWPTASQSGTSSKPLEPEVQNSYAVEDDCSPIRRVPLDLLHEILLHCLPVHPTFQSASPVISSLSRVSSAWRAAVLSSPRLWSSLLVTVQDGDDLDHCVQMVTRWFQHAQSVPLSFFLNIDFEPPDEDIPRIHSFLVDLASVMPRVLHFGLHARLTAELLCSFVDLEWKLPQLKKLDLFSHSGLDQDKAVAFSVPLFQTAPNLLQVAIQNTITDAPDIHHILPWSQLIAVNIACSISIPRWIEVLEMCPKMRVFEVFFNDISSSSLESHYPKGIHHSLERLDLDIEGGPPLLELLSIYSFPSLKALHVLYQSEPPLDFIFPQAIPALANLREFSFSAMGLKIPPAQVLYMVEILREMVNLEELRLQQPTPDFAPLLDAISFYKQPECLLPRLRTLKLWITPESVVEMDEVLEPLFEMVSSRCKEDTIPTGCQVLQGFTVGVENEDVLERVRKEFKPWVGGLPPRLRVIIDLSRQYRFYQPDGWTFPISGGRLCLQDG